MSDGTNISWADATWNVATGCSKLSPGCKNCYMFREYPRLKLLGQPNYQKSPSEITLVHELITKPLHWKKPRRIFPCSMSDLWHPEISDAFIEDVFAIGALCPQHRLLFLTKRAERMLEWFEDPDRAEKVLSVAKGFAEHFNRELPPFHWPLNNSWLGVSVENQDYAWRIDKLAQCPAVVHWVSYEPALGPLDLNPYLYGNCQQWGGGTDGRVLDWVVYGGESGKEARPPETKWFRKVRDDCLAAEVPQHMKQWGEWLPRDQCTPDQWYNARERYGEGDSAWAFVGKKAAGNHLDGQQWLQWPEEAVVAA